MSAKTIAIAAAAFLMAVMGPACAEDCTMRLTASLDVTVGNRNVAMIPVTIAGAPKMLAFSMQNAFTAVDEATVNELHLSRERVTRDMQVTLGGVPVAERAFLPSIQIDHITGEHLPVLIIPSGVEEDDPRESGWLGLDVFADKDLEFDLRNRKLNAFTQDHCPGEVVYWPHTSPVARMSLMRQPTGHFVLPMQLDGKDLRVQFVIGGDTEMGMATAHEMFGLDETSPGMTVAGHFGSKTVYRYPFKSLLADGLAVQNPTVFIVSDSDQASCDGKWKYGSLPKSRLAEPPIGSHIANHPQAYDSALRACYGGSDLRLGNDFLMAVRVYFAFKEGVAYMTSSP